MRTLSLAVMLAAGFALSSVSTDVEAGWFSDMKKKVSESAIGKKLGEAKKAVTGSKAFQDIKSTVGGVATQVKQGATDAFQGAVKEGSKAVTGLVNEGGKMLEGAARTGQGLVESGISKAGSALSGVAQTGQSAVSSAIKRGSGFLSSLRR
jgi:coenzyme F420-reducing hydrogenase alpha subunit